MEQYERKLKNKVLTGDKLQTFVQKNVVNYNMKKE